MYKIIMLSTIIVIIIFGNLTAQTGIESLSLQQALNLCEQNNLTIQQHEQRIRQAMAELSVQKSNYFPTLKVNAGYNYISEIAEYEISLPMPGLAPINMQAGATNQYDLNATLRQPIFTGFRTRNLVKSANETIRQTEYQKISVENRIRLQIHQIFYTAQLNQLQQQVLQSALKRTQQHLQSVTNFYQAGQATAFVTMKIANQTLEIQTQLVRLIHSEKIILSQLAQILNIKGIPTVESFSAKNISLLLQPIEILQEEALQHRPELSQLKHRVMAQRYRKNAVRSALFPQVFANASYHYARPGVNFFRDEWMDYYSIGVNLQWELWNWKRTGNKVKQADYAIRILSLEDDKFLESVRQEVIQAYENLLSDKEQIALTRQLVEQGNERYRITREKFGRGLATSIDLSDAENALTAAELKLQQNYINWMRNKAQLKYATGNIGVK